MNVSPVKGGVERVTWTLRNAFMQQNHNVFIAFDNEDYEYLDSEHKIRFKRRKNWKKIINVLYPFVQEKNIDIIISQGLIDKPLGKALSYIQSTTGCKILTCFHSVPGFERFRPVKFTRKLRKRIKEILFIKEITELEYFMNYGDRLILLSPSYIPLMSEVYGLENDGKIISIPNPVSFGGEKYDIHSKTKERQVLIITRFDEPQKNIRTALRIWKKIEQSTKSSDWKLVLGGYGPDQEKTLEYAKELGLSRFEFIGKVENVGPLYECSPLFMMTSHFEGLSMTLIEALQKGCTPVVFDSFAALHDIISDNYNGAIVPNGNEDAFAARLLELMNNKETCEVMARNGIISIEKFSIDKIVSMWQELFDKLFEKQI